MYQIKRISPTQTAKVVAMLYGIISLIIFVPISLFSMMFHSSQGAPDIFPSRFFLFAPILYTLAGFVLTWLAAHFYNYVVQFTGGIEISLVPTKTNESEKV